jgi:hypothetical protein
MRSSFACGARLLLLAGALGLGCNSLVGNDPHQLDPTTGNTGAAGAHGGGSGQLGGGVVPSGGGHGGTVASGGVPATGGGPAAGGTSGTGGALGGGGAAATGGIAATGGVAAGGHVGSGGVVASGGVVGSGGVGGNGGARGSGGVVGTGTGGVGTGGAGTGGAGTGGAGTGGAGGMCVAPGATCAASTDCCQTSSATPMGAVCIVDDGVCHAKCMTGSQCVSGCCVPVTGETYGVCADAATYCPTLKGVGDPCAADSECASGSCNDWCQASCGSGNSLCSSTPSRLFNSQGQANSCVFTQANTYSCFPGCTNDGDCAVFGSGYTCQIVEDVDGYYPAVCSL